MPDEKTLGFPTYNFVRALIGGCSRVKVGKIFISSYVAGCVVPAEEMASFGTSEYKIDTRRAVVQRQGVLRSRARLDKWKLTFVLQVDEANLPDGMGIEDLRGPIQEAGNRLGLGDFRPQCKGPYGRFVLTDFRVC